MKKLAISLCGIMLTLFYGPAFPKSGTSPDPVYHQENNALFINDNRLSEADTLSSRPSKQPEVGKITPEEERQVERRIISKNYSALGLGPAGLWGLSSSNLDYLFQYAYYWEVAPWASIKLKSDNVFDFSQSSFSSPRPSGPIFS